MIDHTKRGSSCGVVASVLVSDIVVIGFELQFCYYIRFRTYIIGKDVNPLIPPIMG